MISRSFIPLLFSKNFKGCNSKDTEENQDLGEWSEDSINIFSDPQGSLGSRPGYSQLTSASIGSATDWCGFYQFDVHSGGSTTPHYIGGGSDGKVYEYISNGYTQLYTGLPTTNDDDERFSFFSFDNTCIILQSQAEPLAYTGTGSAATFATSVTGDWGLEWQRDGWIHSTVDPRLLYYCTT